MNIKKVKMKPIKKNTVLATGDQVFMKAFYLECTLLNEFTDGFVIRFDQTHHISYITRVALENHFLKM